MAIYWVTLTIPVEADDKDEAFAKGHRFIVDHLCEAAETKEMYGEVDAVHLEENNNA